MLKKIKNTIYKITEVCNKLYILQYCTRKCKKSYFLNKIDNVDILYVTIAFNNASSLKYQLKALKKFSQDKWGYLVVDNSKDTEQSSMIEQWCVKNEIAYVKLPKNLLKLSYSHACALNWTCKNIFSFLKKTDMIGILDHDIFPIRPINIKTILYHQNLYGFKREVTGEKWYLWPGLFFCRLKNICVEDLDFSPFEGMDTGGGIYKTLYKNLDKDDLQFAYRTYKKVQLDNSVTYSMELYDDGWYHVGSGSYWHGLDNIKDVKRIEIGYKIVEKALQ